MPENEDQRDAFGKQQFNVYLPPELVRRIKHAAIDERYSLSRYVEHVFEQYLTRREKEESR